jgi:colicin import membrane protein
MSAGDDARREIEAARREAARREAARREAARREAASKEAAREEGSSEEGSSEEGSDEEWRRGEEEELRGGDRRGDVHVAVGRRREEEVASARIALGKAERVQLEFRAPRFFQNSSQSEDVCSHNFENNFGKTIKRTII